MVSGCWCGAQVLRFDLAMDSDIFTNIYGECAYVMTCDNIYYCMWIFHTGSLQSSWLVNPAQKWSEV